MVLLESPFAGQLHWHQPVPASAEIIEIIHSSEYRHYIEESCLRGKHYVDTGDTIVSEDSYRAALLSAGGAVGAVDAVMREGYKAAFSLTRPPGHHASTEKAMGFCLFNNIAIAARYAEITYGIERICIIDWDVHHGNGTQDVFYASPSILFCSIHQLPLWPNSGEHDETGTKAGKGMTINCPMPNGADMGNYLECLNQDILPKIQEFEPQFFLISAGFDAHQLDPLADIQLDAADFHEMTKWVMTQADRYAHSRIVSVLEGGYNIGALAESISAHIAALVD